MASAWSLKQPGLPSQRAKRSSVPSLGPEPEWLGASTATRGVEAFAADARNLSRPARDWSAQGNARGAFQNAASVVEAEYRCDYAYHAQMEPLNAVASVSPAGDAVEIWAGTQSQTTATEAPAKLLGIPRDKVKLHDLLMGGGFGRRGNRDVDFIIDAVMLSKEVSRPVKVMWTREDDVHNGRFRPLSGHYLRAGFDASGKLTAWHHRVAADRITPFMDPVRFQAGGGRDGMVMAGTDVRGYDIPHQLVEQLYRDTGVRTNPLRGIGVTANKFATEAFMDEVARKRGDRSARLPARTAQGHAPRLQGGRARGADGGLGAQTRRPRARACLHRLFWQPSRRHCRDFASIVRAGRSRCIISGAPSTAASRSSRTTLWRRPKAALSTAWA